MSEPHMSEARVEALESAMSATAKNLTAQRTTIQQLQQRISHLEDIIYSLLHDTTKLDQVADVLLQ